MRVYLIVCAFASSFLHLSHKRTHPYPHMCTQAAYRGNHPDQVLVPQAIQPRELQRLQPPPQPQAGEGGDGFRAKRLPAPAEPEHPQFGCCAALFFLLPMAFGGGIEGGRGWRLVLVVGKGKRGRGLLGGAFQCLDQRGLAHVLAVCPWSSFAMVEWMGG